MVHDKEVGAFILDNTLCIFKNNCREKGHTSHLKNPRFPGKEFFRHRNRKMNMVRLVEDNKEKGIRFFKVRGLSRILPYIGAFTKNKNSENSLHFVRV